MKIADVVVESFHSTSRTASDEHGHGHPAPEHLSTQSLLKIVTDDGATGYCLGGGRREVMEQVVKPMILGEDPFYRERIWQHLNEAQRIRRDTLTDRAIAAVDMALWDLAGRVLNQPVYKLLGAYRDKVPAYASTMCGDDMPGGLSTPEEYAEFAVACKKRGYTAFKLHTWQPPMPGAPDPKRDVAACRAVREAVGDDMVLMLDPYHYYNREQSLYIGRELEKLNYYWMEESMDEHSMSSYVWLTEQLQSLHIVGPETAEGKMWARAEWIVSHASDVSRGGTGDVGGLTPLMKTIHLCESHGVRLEVHGGGAGNLTALCAMGIPGEYFERGLLHPFIDYEVIPPYLNALIDPMDDQGNVHISQQPGLGWDFNWDYIRDNTITPKE
ncbi:MAG TPA: enolase C-terminal domain-like protein [Chloroflexota bacterium]|nr:enolase C-terminal domain-like protein [Chloroflexota bacterium]